VPEELAADQRHLGQEDAPAVDRVDHRDVVAAQDRKSSSPKAGDWCTRPVPSSALT
jgi:hypothetical protein